MNPLAAASDQTMPLGAFLSMMGCLLLMTVVLVLMGALGARRRIRPNEFFGIRTRYTRSSEDAWYTVHELSAHWSIAAGLVCLPGLALLPVATTPSGEAAAVLVPIGISLVVLLTGTGRAHRLAREREAGEVGRADLP